MRPWVQKFYPVPGLGSGERLLWHFHTPVLYWINFSLRVRRRKNSSHRRAILWRDLLRSLLGVLGGIFRSCPPTSQKLPLCGNHQTQRNLRQLLGSLLQNPGNFSEVDPEVRPAVHTAALRLREEEG